MNQDGMQDRVQAPQMAGRLFVALDYPTADEALAMAERLAPLGVGFKVGMQLFYAEGIAVVKRLQPLGNPLFVDLKLHDIPNTVAGAADSLVRHGVTFLNVHTQGGPEMMQAAVCAAKNAARAIGSGTVPKVIGVTLLTSLAERHLKDFLLIDGLSLPEYAQYLAAQAKQCGLDGVVCSAQEASAIRQLCGPDFLLVTPGIRPAGAGDQDQERVMPPAEALRQGADYLVIGRPITGAPDPAEAARRILDEMRGAVPV